MVAEMLAHHISYFPMGWGLQDWEALLQQRPDLVKQASNRVGYRLVVTQASWPEKVKAGGSFKVQTVWRNTAVASFPFRWRPAIYLLDPKQGQPVVWAKVQAIHQWVKQNVKFAASAGKDRGAAQTHRTRTTGDDADPKSLAVALCRAQGIPARLVLIARPGASDHCYYEFYLLDADGNGHWLAADAALETSLRPAKAIRSVVLQKGDKVTIIDPQTKRRVKHRFLADSLQGLPQGREARLQLQLISR